MATRKLDAEARRARRAELAAARAELANVRSTRREEARALRAWCKARRPELREARRARLAAMRQEKREALAALRQSWLDQIAAYRAEANQARESLRVACTVDRPAMRRELARLRDAVDQARANMKRSMTAARILPRMTAAERRAHELDLALHDFPDEWQQALFRDLYRRGKVKATPRRSLSEAFAEWMHDHSQDAARFMADYYARTADEAWAAAERAEYERHERDTSRRALPELRDDEIPF